MPSKHGELIEAIALELAGLDGINWGTEPTAVWFPDFTRAELREGGLTAVVIAPNSDQEAVARGPYSERSLEVHVAVIQPMVVDEETETDYRGWDGGDLVVAVAEELATQLLGRAILNAEESQIGVTVKAQFEPIISATYAKENNLWVSYLKLTINAGF